MARLNEIQELSCSAVGRYNKYARLLNDLIALSSRLELIIRSPIVVLTDVPEEGHPFFLCMEEMKSYVDIQLDIYNTTRKQGYKEVRKALSELPSIDEVMQRFGLEERKPIKTLLNIFMADMVRRTRKRDFIVKNLIEVSEAHKNGWFVIFNTLTIDPKKAFDDGSTVEEYLFRGRKIESYIKKIQRCVLLSLYPGKSLRTLKKELTKDELEVSNYFRYSIVFEPHKNGRPHAHMLMMMKALPRGVSTTDPNLNYNRNTRRQVVGFGKFWPHGFSQPIAVRFDKTDAFSRLGWSWPMDNNGLPIKQNSPKAIAFYIAKYMAKEKQTWKIRASQLFGIRPIIQKMQKMSKKQLLWMFHYRKLLVKHSGVKIPMSLLRQSATRLLVMRSVKLNQIFSRVITWRCLMSRPWLSKNSIPIMQMFSKLNSTAGLTRKLPASVISNNLQIYFEET